MTQMKEIRHNSVQGMLGSDLGQTFPQFTTAGSAGYGVAKKPYFFVRGSERVDVGGYINSNSSDYREVISALQGIGPVHGISRIGSFDRDTRSDEMKISGMGFVVEEANENVMDYSPIPGQMNGLGFEDASANAEVSDFVRIPGDLSGLAQIEEDAILYGDVGLGQSMMQMAQRRRTLPRRTVPTGKTVSFADVGLMGAIRKAAADMNATVKAANAKKLAVARSSPLAATKLAAAARRKSIPGTNVQSAIIKAMNQAAAFAKHAVALRKKGEALLRAGRKNDAAQYFVKAMEASRKAGNTAFSAEKTKIATAADQVAKVAQAQTDALRNMAAKLDAQRGPNPTSDRLRAQAAAMDDVSKRNRAVSATVAAQPINMPGLPTPKRIAELANKYNIRSAGIQGNVSMLATLNGFANDPLAQADDYEGAVMYYGNDLAGRVMADLEYGNYDEVVDGMNALDGLGFLDQLMNMGKQAADAIGGVVKGVTDTVAGATKAVQSGVQAVQNGYKAVADQAKKLGIPLPGGTKPPSVVATDTAKKVAAAASGAAGKPAVKAAFVSRPASTTAASRPASTTASALVPAPATSMAPASTAPSMPTDTGTKGGMPIGLIVGGVAVVGIGAFFLLKK